METKELTHDEKLIECLEIMARSSRILCSKLDDISKELSLIKDLLEK